MKVLVIESKISDFEKIKFALSDDETNEFVHCKSPKDFAEIFVGDKFDLVLSDYFSADKGSLKCLELIRKESPFLPFIIVSNPLGEELAVELIRLGVNDYVSKQNMWRLNMVSRRSYNHYIDQLNNANLLQAFKKINETIDRQYLDKYFTALTNYLYENLQKKLILIGRYCPDQNCVKSVSVRLDGVEQTALIYDLKNTPCNFSAAEKLCVYKKNVQQTFPEDPLLKQLNAESYIGFQVYDLTNNPVGLIVLIDDKSIEDPEPKINLLTLVSYRVGAELERVKTDEILKESEEKFKAISNFTSNWETWIGVDGKPIWINPNVEKLIGYTAEELLNLPNFYEFIIHKDDLAIVYETLQNAITNKTTGGNFEFRCNHRDGTYRWFSVAWNQVYSADGVWLGIRSSGAEITEKKIQEQELLKREKLLAESQQVAKIGSWEWNPCLNEVYLSQQLVGLLESDFNKFPIPVEDFFKIVHSDSHERLNVAIQNAITNYQPKDFEIKTLTKSGEEKHFLIRAANHPSLFESGNIFGTALDITELKKSHQLLVESEFRFKQIFETIQDVYFQTNEEGIITLISPSVFNLLEYRPEEVIGTDIKTYFSDLSKRKLSEAKLNLEGKSDQFELTLLSSSLKKVHVLVKLNFIIINENKVIQGLIRNITEKKKQELKLERHRKKLVEINKLNSQIIEASNQFFYVLGYGKNKITTLRFISKQVSSFLGLDVNLAGNKDRWIKFVHPDDRKLLNQKLTEIIKLKKPIQFSYRIYNQSAKNYLWVVDYACPMLDHLGNIIEIYGSVSDISDLKYAIHRAENEKKQSLSYQYQLLCTQLNPHFIYNTLNTLQYYILNGDIASSLNHTADFSMLMRKVLENSMSKYITLEDEILFLKQYVAIARKKLSPDFTFSLNVDADIDISEQLIPPMLFQTYVENAIIHGFSGDTGRNQILKISFSIDGESICCKIEDNGIGRARARKNESQKEHLKKSSYGMKINYKRINLLNQIGEDNYFVKITDLTDDKENNCGTCVEVWFPIMESISNT